MSYLLLELTVILSKVILKVAQTEFQVAHISKHFDKIIVYNLYINK
jgi:hypothetical protein